MKVLFVCNNAYTPGNGLSASALNTIKKLREHGVDARLMAARNPNPAGPQPDFPLEHFIFPIFEPIVRANGFCYAKVDRKLIEEAVAWADVVHFEEAFFLEKAVRKVAVRQGKARTATFHLYPHNVVANLELGKCGLLCRMILNNWKRIVFNHCSDIQCPTESVRDYLKKNGVKARLHVISNGLYVSEKPVVAAPVQPDPVTDILCIGRLAREKSQDTLLDAMRYSRRGPLPEAIDYWNYLCASYWAIDAGMMRDMAAATGRDAAKYAAMEQEAKAYIRESFLNEDGTFKTDILNTMQTPALFALKNRLFEGEAKEAIKDRLRKNFAEHGNCLQTGFLGTSILMDVLTENGMVDIAYELLLQRKNPSWIYSIDNGATTIWERWNSYTLDKGMGPRGMNSFNHYAYGAVCAWIWKTAAGIATDTAEPGFSHIIMKPVPDRRLGSLDAE